MLSPSLAIIKMLGGKSVDTLGILGVQIAAIAAAALALGIPLGLSVSASVLAGIGKYFALPASTRWDAAAASATAVAALLSMAPVLVKPALMVKRMRPAPVLRQKIAQRMEFHDALVMSSAVGTAIVGLGTLVFLAIAIAMLRSGTAALILTGAVAGCAGAAWLLSAGALAITRHGRSLLEKWPVVRHGIAGLDRPGAIARVLIAAMATALTILIATFETSGAVVRAALDVMPEQRDTLIVAGLRDVELEKVRAAIATIPSVEKVESFSQVRLPLRSWNDSTIKGVTAGPVYLGMCDPGAPGLTMAQDLAAVLGVRAGARLEFEVHGFRIRKRLLALPRLTPAERFWWEVKLDCTGIDPASLLHHAVIRVRPENVAAVRQAIRLQYPTLPAVSAEEIAGTLNTVSQDAMTLARTVAWYAIGAGMAVMLATVAASRAARLNEVGILAALGARPVTVIAIYTVEFGAIGLLAAAIASLLTWGLTSAMLSVVLHRPEIAVDWKIIAAALGGSTLLTVAAGWVPSWGLLKRKPIEILRVVA